ncbi:MAG: hypothetical protein CMD74_02295 [Gammaproteobacteria bacterium]|nr:hypothetical protein [Gammaproteobacteria bacterium]
MPSRRELISLNEKEIQSFLEDSKTLIIVSNGLDGYPHTMPMWFYVDNESFLYCTTFSKSQKVLNWRRDPKACLLVESGETYSKLKAVMIYAKAEIIEEHEAVCDALVNISSRGQKLSEKEYQKAKKAADNNARKRVLLKFLPERYVSWDHSKLDGKY